MVRGAIINHSAILYTLEQCGDEVQVVILCVNTVIPQQKFIELCPIGSQCIGKLALPGERHLVPSCISLVSSGDCYLRTILTKGDS